eukprot:6192678-Pleurochrysis_carterae.AAC.1
MPLADPSVMHCAAMRRNDSVVGWRHVASYILTTYSEFYVRTHISSISTSGDIYIPRFYADTNCSPISTSWSDQNGGDSNLLKKTLTDTTKTHPTQ